MQDKTESFKNTLQSMFKIYDDVVTEDSKKKEIELIKFNEQTLEYYQNNVRGNKDIPRDTAERKMTRNMLLAEPYWIEDKNKKFPKRYYSYGCLRFMVKDGKIGWIENYCTRLPTWEKDIVEYERLNNILGIVSDREY